jgi:hypothetical protein
MAKFPFEKSKADKEKKGGPKEGSKKEERMDKKQFPMFKKGGCVKKMATGGAVMRGTGCATKGTKYKPQGD